jgi:uncharacterized protein (UPF0335 family)
MMEKGTMDRNRILELAVETLEKQKAGIDAEIETVRAELKGTGSAFVPIGRRRPRSQVERKSQSKRMKQYWAAKRAKAAKPSTMKKLPPAIVKRRAKSAAEKKALSLKMKQVWEKKKAEAAKKAEK